MEYMEQIEWIVKANEKDFYKIIYPTVINSGLDCIDIVDILAVIKDIDIYKYNFMDTLARDYCIEMCQKIVAESEV